MGFEVLARWIIRAAALADPAPPLDPARRGTRPRRRSLLPHPRSACADAPAAWPDDLSLSSVNVWPTQFSSEPQLAQRILAILKSAGVEPTRLDCEITENALVDEVASAKLMLTALRDVGVAVAPRRFRHWLFEPPPPERPADRPPQDRPAVPRGARQNIENWKIVRAIVQLAHSSTWRRRPRASRSRTSPRSCAMSAAISARATCIRQSALLRPRHHRVAPPTIRLGRGAYVRSSRAEIVRRQVPSRPASLAAALQRGWMQAQMEDTPMLRTLSAVIAALSLPSRAWRRDGRRGRPALLCGSRRRPRGRGVRSGTMLKSEAGGDERCRRARLAGSPMSPPTSLAAAPSRQGW